MLRRNEQRAFAGVVAEGLFHVDVLACGQGEDGHGSVPVVGGGDGDGVDLFEREDLAEVADLDGGVAELLFGVGCEALEDGGFDIADVADAGVVLVGFEGGEMRAGAAVEADDGEVEAVVGTHDLGVALGGGGYGEAGRANREAVDEFASCDHVLHSWWCSRRTSEEGAFPSGAKARSGWPRKCTG